MSGTTHHFRGPGLFDDDPTDPFSLNNGLVIFPSSYTLAATSSITGSAQAPAGATSGAPAESAVAALDAPVVSLITSLVSVPETSGNLTINLEFDTAAQGAGTAFMNGVEQAGLLLAEAVHVVPTMTVNVLVEFNEGGIAAQGGEAIVNNGLSAAYSTVVADLKADAPGDTNFNALPTGSSIQGQSQVLLWGAQQKALGFLAGNAIGIDGTVDFGTGISVDALNGVALHEISHAMGRVDSGPEPDIFDLFRFTSAGTILIAQGNSAPAAYFSVNGGTTSIAPYGTNSDPSDFLNVASDLNDPFDESYNPGNTFQTLTAVDLRQLDVLGFETSQACFAAGTRVAAPGGPLPVEALRPGMSITTAAGASRPIRWIGHRRVEMASHPAPEQACPIRIRAGALADNVPARDLIVSPEHAMFLDGGLVPAGLLVNGASITRETGRRSVTWYHIELDSHDLLMAEGAPAESYLDTGNRGLFENADQPVWLHASFRDGQAGRTRRSCAPFLDRPEAVEPIWRRIADRAVTLGFDSADATAVTADPDLCIVMNGRRFSPVKVTGDRHVFVLPSPGGSTRLVSRASLPALGRPWIADQRILGVRVASLTLGRGGEVECIALDDPKLLGGWWPAERDAVGLRRWTNGDAVLPLQSFDPVVVTVECDTLPVYGLVPVKAQPDGRIAA